MKTTYTLTAILLIALFATGCSPILKVYAEEEPGINLYQYGTYAWLNNSKITDGYSGPEWVSRRVQEKITNSIDCQMQNLGFSRNDKSPGLLLHYHIVAKNEVLYVRDQWCNEENWNWYGNCNRVRPMNYREDQLYIDFIDAKTGNQVWRGAAVAVRENLTPDQADDCIEDAIQQIFNKFPQKPLPGVVIR